MKGSEFFKEISGKQPFSKMHPKIASFFKDYLSNEKVIQFNDFFVLNTHFPPYPSPSFDNMIEHFNQIGEVGTRKLFSVTLGITNRCSYNCWHCYNAGRSQNDISLTRLKELSAELQEMDVVHITLTGGEPLLRCELEEIAASFNKKTNLTLNTTGFGLTAKRARSLKKSGIFAIGVSLDSEKAEDHDRMRGKKGAFDTSINALEMASLNGLYPYIISVATHDLLKPDNFNSFMRFAAQSKALEVHLIQPCATGKLAGMTKVLLNQDEKQQILSYQRDYAQRDDMPILSSFLYIESQKAFGCGAGLTHLYIDGSGEVSPCNLVPLSFGNIAKEPLKKILDRMGQHFCKPRSSCAGHLLNRHINSRRLPLSPEESIDICNKYLPKKHSIPLFFNTRSKASGEVGKKELKSAYNSIPEYYDKFWLKEAGKPILELISKIDFKNKQYILEAGCGTGFATASIAEMCDIQKKITAVDLSTGMLSNARKRAREAGYKGIRFVLGNALDSMKEECQFDLIFSSWVLGYIPMNSFFASSYHALKPNGQIAFIVHKENSPQIPLEIFGELIGQDPSALLKKVAFDFPRDIKHVNNLLSSAGLKTDHIWEGKIVFRYNTPAEVLEHLLKSGAGTAFYNAIDTRKRKALEKQFLKILAERNKEDDYKVVHDYISCIARKIQPDTEVY